MVRRLIAMATVAVALAAMLPSVALASNTPLLIADKLPPALLRLDPSHKGTSVPSPFAAESVEPGAVEYSVAKTNIQVSYTGFTAPAQAAFQYAVDIWERLIYSQRTIYVNASWAALAPGVLGSAGPNGYYRFTGGTIAYPVALIEYTCNCDANTSGVADINANFSSAWPSWYFGTDANPGASEVDFVSVVLHEIGHGLGFTSGFAYNNGNSQGSWGYTYPTGTNPGTYGSNFTNSVWDSATSGLKLTTVATYPNPSTTLGTAETNGSVYFEGSNVLAVAAGRARLYAPDPWEQGSSMSHLDEATYPAGNANSLMTPSIGYDEAIHTPGPLGLAVMRDIGWDAEGCSTPPFNDVAITHPFCLEIKWMKDNGISTGFPGDIYSPGSVVTRQAMSAFMARLSLGVGGAAALPACSVAPFNDVPTSHTFCKEIKWMKDTGISSGFPGDLYKPADAVTRQAMSAFMARLALGVAAAAALPACATPPFSDVPISSTFCEEIKWMKDSGVSTGLGDGTYGPALTVKRQSMSAFMFRVNSLLP
jgi:hypothetical protein